MSLKASMNSKRLFLLVAAIFIGIIALPFNSVFADDEAACQLSHPLLEQMPVGEVTIHDGEKTLTRKSRIAANAQFRAQGFQNICDETIHAMPILFVFDNPVMPSFHMRNVKADLDIAFIDADGKAESLQTMHQYKPNQRPKYYAPRRPIVLAWEVHAGFFAEQGISLDARFSWQEISVE